MDAQLPTLISNTLAPFGQLFTKPTWKKASLLCLGAILCQGARQISTILIILGMSDHKRFERFHRFLSRDRWDLLKGAKILLGLLIQWVPCNQRLIFVVDETIERRKGKKIKAKGCYRDAVRSTQKHTVTCFGLKWMPLCLMVRLPWAKRPWALPFLTFLQYSKKYSQEKGRKHRTTNDYVKGSIFWLHRWLKGHPWILLGDGGFASIELVRACRKAGGCLISRLRMDARLYDEPPTPEPGKRGRKAKKGKAIAAFKAMLADSNLIWQEVTVNWYGGGVQTIQYLTDVNLMYKATQELEQIRWVLVKDPAGKIMSVPLFSSDINHTPTMIIEMYVLRFGIEVLFEESRAHLGIETQRQWSDPAILRTTPLLFALFSIVCLIALELHKIKAINVQSAAWYPKEPGNATFSNIIACVRRFCWSERYLINSIPDPSETGDLIKLPRNFATFLLDRLAASP